MPDIGFSMIGGTGRLLLGSRPVTDFHRWSAADLPGTHRLKIAVAEHSPHPTWWHCIESPGLKIELDVAGGIWKGSAKIASAEPLVIILEEMMCLP